jgi:hypothetical protein
MTELVLHEIIKKLVGDVMPLGDSSRDSERLKNLETLCGLTNRLITRIEEISIRCKGSHEDSVQRIGNTANKFINQLGERFK